VADLLQKGVTIMIEPTIIDTIHSDGIGFAVGEKLEPWTLHIHRCEKVVLTDTSFEIIAELDKKKLESIDTMIINGRKYRLVESDE
jgi:hypothetical protein